MDIQLGQISNFASGFFNSTFFLVIKTILGIYTFVILADIILLLFSRSLRADFRMLLAGANVPLDVTPSGKATSRRWFRIEQLLKSNNPADWKIAIIEADQEVDKLIASIRYEGSNMAERLNNITPVQISNIEDLRRAHQIRNRIVLEKDFMVAKDEAEEIIKIYRKYLETMEVL